MEEKIFTKEFFKKVFKIALIGIGGAIGLSFIFGGARFSLIKMSDYLFVLGGIVLILGGAILTGTWVHIKKVVKNTPEDEEIDAQSLAPRKFSYGCIIIGALHLLLATVIAFIPVIFV